jgi:hypothetical protein
MCVDRDFEMVTTFNYMRGMAQGLPLGTEGKFAGLFSRSRLRLAISVLRNLSSRIW